MDTLDYLRSILMPLLPSPHAETVTIAWSKDDADTIRIAASDETMALILGVGGHTIASLELLAQLHGRAVRRPHWSRLSVRTDRKPKIGVPIGAPARRFSLAELHAYVDSVLTPIGGAVAWRTTDDGDEAGSLTLPNLGRGARFAALAEKAVQRMARAWCGGRITPVRVALR